MYGYIRLLKAKPNDEEDFNTYRSIYCSLCHSLEMNFGQIPRFLLSYDLTFMALLADSLSLYEDTQIDMQAKAKHCWQKLGKVTPVFGNRSYLDYAANVSLLLAEQKLLDDKLDKEHLPRRLLSQVLFKQAFWQAKQNYPKLASIIEANMQAFNAMESKLKGADSTSMLNSTSMPNSQLELVDTNPSCFVKQTCLKQLINCLEPLKAYAPQAVHLSLQFAEVLAQIFSYLPLSVDIIQRPGATPNSILQANRQPLSACLGVIGAYLGAWLYLVDALSDLASDINSGHFNILLASKDYSELRPVLKQQMQKLPLFRQKKWQAKHFRWKEAHKLTTSANKISNLILASSSSLKNLQATLDASMALLPYQRSARLVAKVIQLGLDHSLEHNKLLQAYIFNLLKEAE